MKLPIGQKNVLRTILKPGYAEGAEKPKRIKKPKIEAPFNTPTIIFKLRSEV